MCAISPNSKSKEFLLNFISFFAEIEISMRRIFTLFMLLSVIFPLCAEVSFSGLNLNDEDQLLFSAEAENPSHGVFNTLFTADLATGRMKQLTFFPEKLIYLQQSGQLQIQNRFGIFRINSAFQHPQPVKEFPSFIEGTEIGGGKIKQVGSSPDGRYVLYLAPVGAAYADLMLLHVSEEKVMKITAGITLSFDSARVRWSPDSNYFIYEKGNFLYYFSLDQLRRGEVITEDLRLLGKGSLKNIRWSSQNQLYYIAGSVLFRIHSAEFFTRSFYSDLLDAGQVIGKIPFTFDSNFDSFYISPDGEKMLFNKGGRNLILYFLKSDDYLSTGITVSLPYLYLPRNTRIKQLLWSDSDIITVLTGSIRGGKSDSSIFRLRMYAAGGEKLNTPLVFNRMSDRNVTDIVLSPDKKLVSLLLPDRLIIRDYTSWAEQKSIQHSDPLQVVWTADDELVVAGPNLIERYRINETEPQLIALSQAGTYGYGPAGGLYSRFDGRSFLFSGDDGWKETTDTAVEFNSAKIATDNYRVYLRENPEGSSYRNVVMVRRMKEYKTTQLSSQSGHSYEAFPGEEETIDFVNFTHGSRIRRREVSLVFNAVDSVEGLTEVLTVLQDYGLKCTFFINGEFMRRNPEAVQELAVSGHEIGSLFYTYFNMTDARYRITMEFIKQGLARNEDEYFNLTTGESGRGAELALLWHAPYYFVNSEIIAASHEMNYTYVGYDVDPLDWVPKTESRESMYKSVPELVERILSKKKPGSIIPVRIGTSNGAREDYLFQHLDLVINGMIDRGYSIVPVSTLIEHAR